MSRHFKTKYLQKQRQRHIRRLFGMFCLFSVIGCFVYLILFSGIFQIKDIKIIGTKRVPEGLVRKEIETLIGGKSVLPINNNLVFVEISDIKKIFLADISQVRVSKNFFTRTLNVYVTEKSPIARITFESNADSAFMEGSSNTYLSLEGKIFKSNLLKNEKLLNIKIKNQNTNNLNQIWDKNKIESFEKLVSFLKTKNIKLETITLEYSLNTPSAITLVGMEDYKMYLTLNTDIIDAFNAGNQFFEKESKNKTIISNYIDMRYYPEKLYYK